MKSDKAKFETFRKLHDGFLVLPGTTDLLSALMLNACGYPAVATTSVGLGYAVGCPQSEAISKELMLEIVGNICRAVSVPVELDFESGYSDTAEGVEESVKEVIDLGVVAVRLEDSIGIPGKGMRPPEEHAERIRAARRAGDKAGVPLFITGRTDPFWNEDGATLEAKIQESITRGNIYLDAGADAMFISGNKVMSKETIGALVHGLKGQFATCYRAGGPSIRELRELGVHRLTMGSLLACSQLGYMEKALSQVLHNDDPSLLEQFAIPARRANDLVTGYWANRNQA